MGARLAVGLAALSLAFAAHASCGAAFCMVNTSWDAQGVWIEPGTRLDVRYEFVPQDQPRAGSEAIAVGAVSRHHDEARTLNRNLVIGLERAFDAHWGMSASAALVQREHEHVHNHHGTALGQEWRFSEPGDLRLLGRYQFDARQSGENGLDVYGLDLGLKLPTGAFDVRNAEGETAERTLQPGTGTTDLLAGGYYARRLPLHDLSLFGQALVQQPLNRHAGYRPGTRVSVDVGVRYEAGASVALLLQLNLLVRARDRGAEAEPEDSGGRFAYLSPGLSWNATQELQLYGFVQLPLYQYVNGVQLTADYAAVIGASTRF